jgi:hypothetical protein
MVKKYTDENLRLLLWLNNGGDTINYTLATTASSVPNVGDYPISCGL